MLPIDPNDSCKVKSEANKSFADIDWVGLQTKIRSDLVICMPDLLDPDDI